MAAVKKEDIPRIAVAMQMIWKLIKDFYIPESSEEYWEQFCDRCREIDTYSQSRLIQIILSAIGDYLEEKQTGVNAYRIREWRKKQYGKESK